MMERLQLKAKIVNEIMSSLKQLEFKRADKTLEVLDFLNIELLISFKVKSKEEDKEAYEFEDYEKLSFKHNNLNVARRVHSNLDRACFGVIMINNFVTWVMKEHSVDNKLKVKNHHLLLLKILNKYSELIIHEDKNLKTHDRMTINSYVTDPAKRVGEVKKNLLKMFQNIVHENLPCCIREELFSEYPYINSADLIGFRQKK